MYQDTPGAAVKAARAPNRKLDCYLPGIAKVLCI